MPYLSVYGQNFASTGGGDLTHLDVSGNINTFGTINIISNAFFMNTLKVNSNLVITTNAFVGTTLNVVSYINTAFVNTNGITTTGNVANTVGNVALTGNLITTNIFCTNVITQSNISNTSGNVAITGNLITTNVFCTNVITQASISAVSGTVQITGNVNVQKDVTANNLTITSNLYGIFALTGSSYYFTNTNINLPTFQTKGSGVYYSGVSIKNFTSSALASSRYIDISTNGNFRFNTQGLYRLVAVFATDAALGRVAIGSSSIDRPADNRNISGMDEYLYVYQCDVTQVPTVPIIIPFLVADTNKYYYIDIFAYRTLPTVLYKTTDGTLGDYTVASPGTYITLGPF